MSEILLATNTCLKHITMVTSRVIIIITFTEESRCLSFSNTTIPSVENITLAIILWTVSILASNIIIIILLASLMGNCLVTMLTLEMLEY